MQANDGCLRLLKWYVSVLFIASGTIRFIMCVIRLLYTRLVVANGLVEVSRKSLVIFFFIMIERQWQPLFDGTRIYLVLRAQTGNFGGRQPLTILIERGMTEPPLPALPIS